MKICVTGHEGFIGKALMNELQILGHDVCGFEKSSFYEIYSLVELKKFIRNYFDENKPEVIFHVGACSDTLNQDYNEMITLNAESTYIIADWCVDNNVPIIYSSSAACYGFGDASNLTLYAWSKLIGENYIRKSNGVSLRYFNVYGYDESHKGRMASVAYQSYVKQKLGEEVKLFPLKPARDFVYIKDVISANIYAMENYEKLSSKVYDVGTGKFRYFEDVLDLMGIPYSIDDVANIPKKYQFITMAQESKFMDGWKPKWFLEDGIKDYLVKLSQ